MPDTTAARNAIQRAAGLSTQILDGPLNTARLKLEAAAGLYRRLDLPRAADDPQWITETAEQLARAGEMYAQLGVAIERAQAETGKLLPPGWKPTTDPRQET